MGRWWWWTGRERRAGVVVGKGKGLLGVLPCKKLLLQCCLFFEGTFGVGVGGALVLFGLG